MRRYEVMLILPPDADEAVVGRVTDRVAQVIGDRGGEVSSIDRWGKRRMSYQIRKQSEGYYLVLECRAEPEAMNELDRVLALADEVMRFKVVVRTAA